MRRERSSSARPRTAPLAAAIALLGLALPAPWGAAPTPAGGLWAALGGGGTASAQTRAGAAPLPSRTRVSGAITADTTWRRSKSPYLVTATVTVGGGATLTIQPGVEVRFAAGAGLHVGVETAGALIAVGTATQRIRFTSAAATKRAGGWGSVALSAKTRRSSRISHARFDYARSGLSLDGVPEGVRVSDTSIRDSSQDGIFIGSRGSAAVVTRMSVSRAGRYALNAPRARGFRLSRSRLGGRLNAPRAARADWGPGNTLTDFGAWAACVHPVLVEAVANSLSGAAVILVKGGSLIKSASWPARTYRMLGSLLVASSVSPTLTLAPGSTLRFANGAGLYVGLTPGGGGNPGGLVAVGTAEAPIRFTADAAQPVAGAWDGLRLYAKTLATSRLEHVTIEYTVRGLWLLSAPAGLAFKHATIRHSSRNGVEIRGGGATFEQVTLSDGNFAYDAWGVGGHAFTLRNSTLRGPFYGANAESAVLENNTFHNSPASVVHPNLVAAVAAGTAGATAQTVLGVAGGTLWKSGTWPARTYRLLGELIVGGEASPVLTVAAGATLRGTGSGSLTVGRYQPGGLVAVGTPAAPIVFTADAAQPVAGAWSGLSLHSKTLATSRLEHVAIEYGFRGLQLREVPAGVRLTHGTVRKTKTHGVDIAGTASLERWTVSEVAAGSDAIWSHGPTLTLRHSTVHGRVNALAATTLTLTHTTVHGGLNAPLAATAVLQNNVFRDSAASVVHPNLVASFAASIPGATAQTVLGVAGGTLSKSAAWPARTYRVLSNNLVIAGNAAPVLTLAAGTTLRLAGNEIDVGQWGFGGLVAVGTAAAPIRFTAHAAQPVAGAWWSISLHGKTLATSRLEHVTIEYGRRGLRLSSVPPGVRFRHGVIRHVAQHGVEILAGTASFDTWTISHSGVGHHAFFTRGTAFALRNSTLHGSLAAPSAADAVLENNTYQASTKSQLHPNLVGAVAAGTIGATAKTVIPVVSGTLSKSATWPARTYRLLGLSVAGSASPVLTLAPGSTLRFSSSSLDVGDSAPGGLVALGTTAAPIRFTTSAAQPTASAWNGIRLLGKTLAATQLAHVTVEYAWRGLRLEDTPSGVVLRDGTVRHASGNGISLQRTSPTLTRWTLSGVAGYGVDSSTGSPQLSQLSISGAGGAGVRFNGSSGRVSDSTITGGRGNGVDCQASGWIELLNNRITGNAGRGVYCSAAAHIEGNTITGNGVGIELTAAPALLAIHHNDLSANTVPIKSTATAGADARWNWWGSAAGPSGVVGRVRSDPWLGAAPTAPFRIEDAVASPARFAPGGSSSVASLTARAPQAASWSLVLRDGAGTTVRSFTATGTAFSQDWDGVNAASAVLAAGSYRYTLSARPIAAGGKAAAPVVGDLALVAGDLVAEIASPGPEARLRRAASLVVRGRALGTGFGAYELDFAAGADPGANSFTRIARGTAAVASAAPLGTWNTSLLSEGVYTLRLRTLGAGGAAVEERVIVSLLALGALTVSPGHFSPNADARQDVVTAQATATARGSWTAQVRSAAGAVLRSYSERGSVLRIAWDGRNAAGAIQPDGTYTLALRMAAPGGTPLEQTGTVVLDVTAPTAVITAPAADTVLRNYREATVTGTASDTHFVGYELQAVGGRLVVVIKRGTAAVTAGTLGTLADRVSVPRYQEGTPYQLVLLVEDRAGNLAVATRALRFDRIQLSNLAMAPRSIDPEQDETTRISYRLSRAAAVTVQLVAATPAGEGGTTYTLVDNRDLSPGLLTTTWNGKDAAGKPAARDFYYLHIAARDADGRSVVYDASTEPLEQAPSWSDVRYNGKANLTEVSFDPYRNDELRIEYQMSQVARHLVAVAPGKNPPINAPNFPLRDQPVPAGANQVIWTGRLTEDARKPYSGPFGIYLGAPQAVSKLSLVVSSPPFRVESFRTNPYLFRPAHAEVVHISYNLGRAAQVQVDVVDPEGNHWLRLQEPTAQTPGAYALEWSGRDSAGKIATPEGLYTVEVTATETGGRGDRTVRRGNLLVYR